VSPGGEFVEPTGTIGNSATVVYSVIPRTAALAVVSSSFAFPLQFPRFRLQHRRNRTLLGPYLC